jgi:hypothetical protein
LTGVGGWWVAGSTGVDGQWAPGSTGVYGRWAARSTGVGGHPDLDGFSQPISSGGDSLRGRLDVGGISMGIGVGLIRPAGRGQWERPAGRWATGGWNRFVRAAVVDFGILRE